MNQFLRFFSTLIIISLLSACGTTTGLKSPGGGKFQKKATPMAGYDQVVVMTFEDNAESAPMNGGKDFANLIASKVAASKAYSKVSRHPLPGKSIVVSGNITEFDEGNVALRLLVGLGTGSSKFDAKVNFTDSETGRPIGEIMVDKNSWLLGGVLAATQTTKTHMTAAASKIAKELKKARQR